MLWTLLTAAAGPWLTDPTRPLPDGLITRGTAISVMVPGSAEELEARGFDVRRRSDGTPMGGGGRVAVFATRDQLMRLEERSGLVFDRHIDLGPEPLRDTRRLVGADSVWASPVGATGEGVRVGNIDSHIDVLHPHFFRADGGVFPWTDVDGDGVLTPGVDGLDRNEDGDISDDEVLRELDSLRMRFGPNGNFVLGADEGVLNPERDWLYLDLDGDGQRTAGRPDYTDADPGFAEPTFVPDDVDGDGVLDPDERLWQLGSSVIAAVYWAGTVYERGDGLTRYARRSRDWDAFHGTGVSGIITGGQLHWQRPDSGLAPGADLVFISRYEVDTLVDLVDYIAAADALEVDVLLHEYAPWLGYAMDGTEPIETLVDELAIDGMAQVCAAGNLADAGKHGRLVSEGGGVARVQIELVPEVWGFWLEWHGSERVPCELDGPAQGQFSEDGQFIVDDTYAYVETHESPGGSVRTSGVIWRDTALPSGTYTLTCQTDDPLDVYLVDGTGWERGSVFSNEVRASTMGIPSTAEHCIAVGAYAGVSGDAIGQLHSWSSRGPALGGQKTIDIAAPDDPFSPTPRTGADRDGDFFRFSGTSGAAPHVAAAAALLVQSEPELNGAEIRQRLMERASVDEHVQPGDGWGAGKTDIAAVLDAPRIEVAPSELTVTWAGLYAVVEGADTVHWDFDYDGTVDHVGPSAPLGWFEVARVEGFTEGYRVGGLVVRSPEREPITAGCGCRTEPGLFPGIARRR